MFQNWEFLILEIWAHLLAAVVMTLILSWAIWGMRVRSERVQLDTLKNDLQNAKRSLDAKESDLSQAFQKQEQLKDRMSGFQAKLAESMAAQAAAEESATADRQELSKAKEKCEAIERELSLTRKRLAALQAEAAETIREEVTSSRRFPERLALVRDRLADGTRRFSAWTKETAKSWLGRTK